MACDPSDKEARNFADTFVITRIKRTSSRRDKSAELSLDDLFSQIQAGNLKELNVDRKSRCTGFCRGCKTES